MGKICVCLGLDVLTVNFTIVHYQVRISVFDLLNKCLLYFPEISYLNLHWVSDRSVSYGNRC